MTGLHSMLLIIATLASLLACVLAYTICFQNTVGTSPNGQPDQSVFLGQLLNPGQGTNFGVSNNQLGICAWGCKSLNYIYNCHCGACNGGLVCNNAGITSRDLLSEYGLGHDGQVYWTFSYICSQINIPTRLTGSDGQQAFQKPNDFRAIHNLAQGDTYNHHFCG
ncbi:hypothetical protein CROQUDRAFT_667943 [Cronartium quercuum f. sp. fusiforme G11]|uniref:Uncharacterized protein n=1 Tax=Cronartium quercuum f. sp. fusiforme G11 TaxID=708437 RepID=A0A9P6TG44_9BASI|nr:hypothetical protein CROQUDRAFT_667943 [Cronartium quercuum f. sp. fusiforme G11]